jgi:hypothetical protein
MKKFRITEIKEAVEPLFGIAFEKMRSRVWQEVDSPLYTIYYYEDFGDANAMVFDGFINLATNKIVVSENTTQHYFEFHPENFSSTKKITDKLIQVLSGVMKNRYKAIMRERKIDAILA